MMIIPPPNTNLVDFRRGRSGKQSPLGKGMHHPIFLLGVGAVFGFFFSTFLDGDDVFWNGTGKLNFLSSGSEKLINDGLENGWKRINVFYGSSDHVESLIPPNKQWYSQARQDEVVISLLGGKRGGFFIDLAANDATVLSNTYALEKSYGWRGLCIEPNADYFYNLTHYRGNCELVAAVIGGNRMEKIDFFAAGDHSGIVGFDNPERLRKKSRQEYTVTLEEILWRFNAPVEIDYLSLDVEGAEEYIMAVFPFEKYRIKLMTIERPKEKLRDLLASRGYMQIQRLSRWGECLFAHRDIINELDMSRLDEFNGRRQYLLEKEASKLREEEKKR